MQQPRQQQPHRPLAAWQQPSSTSSSWSAPQRDRHDFGMWGHGAFGPGQPSGDWNVSAQEFVPSGGLKQGDISAIWRPGEGNQEGPPGCVNQMGPQGKGMGKMSYPRGQCLQFAGLVPAPCGVPCGWSPTMGLGVRPPGVPHGTVAVGGHGMNFHGRWFDGPDALMSPAPPGPTQLAFGGMEGDASSDLDRVQPPGFLALWRLEGSYTVAELARDPLEYDFEPEEVVSCDVAGAFGFYFKRFSEAKSLEVALDKLQPPNKVLTKCKAEYNIKVLSQLKDVDAPPCSPKDWLDGDLPPPCLKTAMLKKWAGLMQG